MDGLKHLKEANQSAGSLLADYPDVADAYIALGIANYIIGSQSAGARFLLWFDGVHGNKKLGMEQVAKAAASGRYLRPSPKPSLRLPRGAKNKLPWHNNYCGN